MEEAETPGIPQVKLAFRVAYRGDNFNGSQMQPGLRTVEGEFIAACIRLGLFEDWRKARFAASGRTDRGVHATGQVFSFLTGIPDRAVSALNYQLPPDCWCTGYAVVEPGFHPRYDAKYRTYRYFFREQDLDAPRMETAAMLFQGNHDFSGFARVDKKKPERKVLAASIGIDNGVLFLEITAESFLWHMYAVLHPPCVISEEEHVIWQLLQRDLWEIIRVASTRRPRKVLCSGMYRTTCHSRCYLTKKEDRAPSGNGRVITG